MYYSEILSTRIYLSTITIKNLFDKHLSNQKNKILVSTSNQMGKIIATENTYVTEYFLSVADNINNGSYRFYTLFFEMDTNPRYILDIL